MPKIDAPTVAEHRAARRQALLAATRELLADPGRAEPPTLGEVAAKAGMSRPSAYSYFASRDDLMQAAVHEAFPRWAAYVNKAVDSARTPHDQVLAYIDVNLHLIANGHHSLIRALTATKTARHSANMAHESIRMPLTRALTNLRVAEPAAMSELIQAVVFSAARMIDAGTTEADAVALVHALVEPYLSSR